MDKDTVIKELMRRGIEVDIGGCGCCDSPWVKVKIDREVVFDDEGKSANFEFSAEKPE